MTASTSRTGRTVEQRRAEVLARLDEHGRVEVSGLAAALTVTEETIRRDLRALERAGRLQRAHGGAVRLPEPADRSVGAATVLAVGAAATIELGSTVLLGGGAGCEALAGVLAARDGIVLVTASVPVALAAVLADERATVHLLGGTVDEQGMLNGAWARDQLAGLRLDVAVVEARGLAPDGRLLHASPEEAALVAAAVAQAASSILLADSSTFGTGGLVASIAGAALSRALLADGVDPEAIEALTAAGVHVEMLGAAA